MILSIFGHELDKQIIDDCKEVSAAQPLSVRFWKNLFLSPYMIFPEYFVRKLDKIIHKERYVLDDKFDSIEDMFESIKNKAFLTIKVMN